MGTNITSSNARTEQYPDKSGGGVGGGLADFALFFALMPGDNTDTVAGGTPVDFPQNGPISGTAISRIGPQSFLLATPGIYEVVWQVSVAESGQLVLVLNGVELAATVVGRATGTDQIFGHCLIVNAGTDSTLTVNNPTGNAPALTITPIAGGTHPVSATLFIAKLQ